MTDSNKTPRPLLLIDLLAGFGVFAAFLLGWFASWLIHRQALQELREGRVKLRAFRIHWWHWHALTLPGRGRAIEALVETSHHPQIHPRIARKAASLRGFLAGEPRFDQ